MGVMDNRRAILLNEPHIETAAGRGVAFMADRAAKIEECTIDLTAAQSGTGTPSPTNVRPITGYKDFSVFHSDGQNQQEYTFSWQRERALGTYDMISGILYTTGYVLQLRGGDGWQSVGSKFYYQIPSAFVSDYQQSITVDEQRCNMYPFASVIGNGSVLVTMDKHFYLQRDKNNASYCRVWVYDSDYTLEQFKALLNQTPLLVTIPVSSARVVLTPIPIKAFRGQNSIWNSNNGEMTVKYWTH